MCVCEYKKEIVAYYQELFIKVTFLIFCGVCMCVCGASVVVSVIYKDKANCLVLFLKRCFLERSVLFL